MTIKKYIQELLLENETVIIPGFGAFISNYKPAEINTETNEIKPPSKEISFNQQIRNNDGLLVDYVAICKNISHFDALKEIENERENIVYQLDKGEKVVFDKTGILFYNKNNKLQFDPFQNENLLLDSFGLETTSLTIPPIEEEPDEEVLEAIVLEKTENPVQNSEPKQKKKRNWVWLLLIFIPLIVAGIIIINNKTKTNSEDPANIEESVKVNTEEQINTIDTTQVISTQAVEPDTTITEKTKVDTIKIADPTIPKYILVGGSFKDEENAEVYLQQLKAEGYNPFHLGKRGNFYIIGIGIFNSEKEADIAKWEFLSKNPGSGVWIKKE